MKQEGIVVEGKVEEVNGYFFKVRLQNDMIVQAYLSGKMRKHFIRTIPGDTIKVELSPYDLSKGRIVFRDKGAK